MTDVVEKGYLEARTRERRRAQMDEALGTIRDEYGDVVNPTTDDAAGPPTRTPPTSRPPFDIDALSVLDEATRCLTSWATLVADERHVSPHYGRTAASVAHWLTLHTEWLAAHDTAGDAVREFRFHASKVHAAAIGRRVQRVRIGPCPERRLVDGEPTRDPCPGTLYALIRQDDNGLLPDRVQCDDHREHVWAPWQWPNLGRRLGHLDPSGVHRLIARLSATRYRSE